MLRIATQRNRVAIEAHRWLVLALVVVLSGCGGVSGETGRANERSLDAAVVDARLIDATDTATEASRGDASAADAQAAQWDARVPDASSSDASSTIADADDEDGAGSANPSSLAVSPPKVTLISGAAVTLVVTATFADGTVRDVTGQATFVAADPTVVVLKGNVATAYIPGTTTVTISALGLSVVASIEVSRDSVSSVEVTSLAMDCDQQHWISFRATALDGTGRKRDVTREATWSASPANILLLPAVGGGVATCLGAGRVTVSAAVGSARGETSIDLHGPAVSSFTLLSPGVLRLDDQVTLETIANYEDGTTSALSRTSNAARFGYRSSDPTLLQVEALGQTRALALGAVTVSATLDGAIIGTATVRISDADLQSIAIFPSTIALTAPMTGKLTAIGTYADGTQADISESVMWSSEVVAVGQGTAYPIAVGSSSVVARLEGKRATMTAEVLAGSPDALSLAFDDFGGLPISAGKAVRAMARYANGSEVAFDGVVTWQIADPTVVAIGGTPPLVTGSRTGTTTFVARWQGLQTMPQAVTVIRANPVAFHLGFDEMILGRGDSSRLPATADFDNEMQYDLAQVATFTSANTNIVRVSNAPSGTVTAVAPGRTTVTIAALGLTIRVPVTVDP